MPPKDVERMANSVDPDQSSLIRIYIVCSDIHVPIFRIFTVDMRLHCKMHRHVVILEKAVLMRAATHARMKNIKSELP